MLSTICLRRLKIIPYQNLHHKSYIYNETCFKTNSTVTVKKTIVTTTIHTVNSQAENPVMKADSKPASKPKAAHTPKPPHSIGNVYVPKPPAAKKVARAPPKPKAMAAPNSGMTVTSSKTTQKTTTVKASTTRTQNCW